MTDTLRGGSSISHFVKHHIKMSNNGKGINDKVPYNNDDTSWAIEALMAMGGRKKQQSSQNITRKRDEDTNSALESRVDSPSNKKQTIEMNKDDENNKTIRDADTFLSTNSTDNISNLKSESKQSQEQPPNEMKVTKQMLEKMNKEIEVLKSAINIHKSIDPEGRLPLILPKKGEEENVKTKNKIITAKTARNNSRGSYRCKLCDSLKKHHVCKGSSVFYFYNHANVQTDCSGIVPLNMRDSKVSMKSGRVLSVSVTPYKEYATH